ncbi:MAG: cox cluster protein [Haloarculaceae archaeon]
MQRPIEAVSGRRVVLIVYATAVGVAAMLGLILGVARPVALDPVLFGVIQLPPTPLGMVAFGVVHVGVGLGVLLVAIHEVGKRFDRDLTPGPGHPGERD